MSNIGKNCFFRPFGWNEYVKELYRTVQEAVWCWKFHYKPTNGIIYHNVRFSTSSFNYSLCTVKISDDAIRADSMASKLLNFVYDLFCTDMRKLKSSYFIPF